MMDYWVSITFDIEMKYLIYNFIKRSKEYLASLLSCWKHRSVEVSEDLATNVLSLGFFVIHNSEGCCENDISKLSWRKDLIDKLLEVFQLEIVSWRNNSTFVKSSVKLNDNLAVSLVVYNFKLIDVSVLLHHSEELDDNLGCGSQENL